MSSLIKFIKTLVRVYKLAPPLHVEELWQVQPEAKVVINK